MGMADKKTTAIVSGSNGGKMIPEAVPVADELERARDIARRYRCEFIDLSDFQLHHDLFEKIPVHLMFRYKFVPLEETADGRLAEPHEFAGMGEGAGVGRGLENAQLVPIHCFPPAKRRASRRLPSLE